MRKILTLFVLFFLFYTTSYSQCSEGINQTFAIIDTGSSGNIYYNLQSTSSNPNFENAFLGSYCPNGRLILQGGQNQVYKCNGADIWQNSIYYRIYPTSSSSPGAFNQIAEYYQSGYSNGCGGADQTWEANGSNINLLSGLSAGTYYLEVYSTADYQYCGTGTIYASNSGYNYRATFTVNASPTVTVNSPSICEGNIATLTASGGASYLWSTSATSSSITSTTAGTYTVTTTNSSGCTASASGTVVVNPNPTAYAGDDTFVNFVTNVILGDSASIGGTPPYTFAWTPGAGLSDSTAEFPVCTPLITTKYFLTVTDSNGCSGRDSVVVAFNKGDNPLTDIVYSAQNLAYTDSGQYLEFDLFASDTPTNLLFSQGQIYLTYDTAYFGANLISSGAITVTKGQAIDSPYYNLSVSDSTRNMMKLSITHTASPASLVNLDSVNQQLCHFKFRVASVGTPFVSFDSILMVGQSLYQRTTTSLEFPYDLVQVRGLVGALRSYDSVYFSIANTVLSGSPLPTYFDFDIVGNDQGTNYLNGYSINLSYNANAFDSAYFTDDLGPGDDGSGTGTSGSNGGNAIYSFSHSFSGGVMNISISPNGYFDPFDQNQNESFDDIGSPGTIAHITLHISDCANLPQIAISPASSASYLDATQQSGVSSYAADTAAPASYNNDGQAMCLLPPHVDHLSSDCIGAGTFDTLTIFGSGFGTDQGSVWFTNANSGGGFFQAYHQDILLWTPTQIQMYVPYIGGMGGTGTAGGGNFYIQTAGGLNNAGDSAKINIGYSLNNYRTSYDSTAEFMYRDSSFVFQLDTTLWNTPGVKATVQHVMADMNCQMGVNFSLDTSGPSAIDSVYPSHINLISIQPNSYRPFLPPNLTAIAYTDPFEGASGCAHNLPQYNNIALCVHQVNISFRAVPYYGGTWNWSDANAPSNTQYDFATILAHELGHAAMLGHNSPFYTGDVMAPIVQKGYVLQNYDSDPNDIEGVYHSISIGTTIGAAGGCPHATQVFSGSCSHIAYACTPAYPDLGISPVATTSSFSAWLYPNPWQNNTVVHVDVSSYGDYTISVYDVVGQQVWEQHISSGTSFDLPLSGFQQSTGMYLVQVSDGHSRVVLKMVKL